jgi:tetratricopeptide (TPR) repeat protein
MMNNKNRNIIILAIGVLLLLVIAYSNHFNNGFHFDDSHTIENNVHIRSLKNIPSFFSDPKMFSSSPNHYGMRPIVTTTLAIDYWLGGKLEPFYFQLSTFIWHILLGAMLFFMYKKLLNISFQHSWISYIALFASGWFVLHTVNAETINYIISRSDVQSTFLIVASFLIYISYPKYRKYYLYIIPAVIGVFAKETVLVLIILLFFYINLFENKLSVADLFKGKNFKMVFNSVKKLLPILVIVIALQVYTLTRVTAIPGISNSPGYYWLTQSFVWLHYFTSFFLPTHLSADTDWSVILTVLDRRIIIGITFVIALFIAIFKTSKNASTKPIAFGLIWFAASLLPTSLAPFAEVANDHRMYFAFVGLSLSVVTFISQWLIARESKIMTNTAYKTIMSLAVLVVLSLNAYGVYQRNKVWKNEETLWYDVTIKSPLNGRGLMNYGLTQMSKGNYEGAMQYFERAKEFLPAYNVLFINIGIAKGAIGKHQEAEENFKKAIRLSPNFFNSYMYYGRYLNNQRRYDEAQVMGEKAFELNPHSLFTLNVLMEAYQNLGMWEDLEKTANYNLNLLPNDALALNYLAAAKAKKTVLKMNLETKKNLNAADYLNLSLAFYNSGEYEKCIEACKNALKLKPDYADAYSNIGASYNMLKQWQRGIEACKKALLIDPNHKLAKGNLAWAISEMK